MALDYSVLLGENRKSLENSYLISQQNPIAPHLDKLATDLEARDRLERETVNKTMSDRIELAKTGMTQGFDASQFLAGSNLGESEYAKKIERMYNFPASSLTPPPLNEANAYLYNTLNPSPNPEQPFYTAGMPMSLKDQQNLIAATSAAVLTQLRGAQALRTEAVMGKTEEETKRLRKKAQTREEMTVRETIRDVFFMLNKRYPTNAELSAEMTPYETGNLTLEDFINRKAQLAEASKAGLLNPPSETSGIREGLLNLINTAANAISAKKK